MRVTEQQALGLRDIGYVVRYPTDMNGNKFGSDKDYLPHIDAAIRWMREVKGVHVCPLQSNDDLWISFIESVPRSKGLVMQGSKKHQSHDLAQSAGLDAAIEYVKREQL